MTMQTQEQQAYEAAHARSDVDGDRNSIHHTLGQSPNQAAPGNHKHEDVAEHEHPDYAPVGHEHPDYENQEITEIPAGSTVRLKKGITGPGAPTVSSVSVVKTVTSPQPSNTKFLGSVIHAGYIYSIIADNPMVYRTPVGGGTQEYVTDLNSSLGLVYGVTLKDGFWYILGESPTSSQAKIMKFDEDWILISSITLAANPTGISGLVWHTVSNCWLICYANGSGKLVFREVNATNGATILNTATTLDYDVLLHRSVTLLYGSFDYGDTRIIAAIAGYATADNRLYVFNTAYARSSTNEWPLRPSYALNALGWDTVSGEFRQLTSSVVIQYSDDMADMPRKYAGTSLNADGTYVSMLGDSTDFTPDKRSFVRVNFPAVPEEVASIDTYVAKQSDSLFKKQTPTDRILASKLNKYLEGANWAGDAPPGASTWPASAAAMILSDDGLYYFNADGDLVVRNLSAESGASPIDDYQASTETVVIGSASTWTSKDITFPRPFDVVPTKVDAWWSPSGTPSGEVRVAVQSSTITATGFTVWVWRNTTTNLVVGWEALVA